MKCAIYGAGGNGQKFYAALIEAGFSVQYFIDEYTSVSTFNDTNIYRIVDAPDKGTPVFVSVSCYSHQIAQDLLNRGHKVCYDFNESIKAIPTLLNHFFKKDILDKIEQATRRDTDKLNIFKQKLSDQTSLKILESIIQFRLSPTPENYLENDWKVQYFSDDIPLLRTLEKPVRMLDCGAFTGDTLPSALQYFESNEVRLDSVTLFEPNLENFEKLGHRIKSLSHLDTLFTCFPCGLWSSNTELQFELNADASHIVNDSGQNSESLQVVKLDDVAYGSKPNFIKMDIEGAEIEAIHGAENIIKDYTPTMALSVYHFPDHLWRVAELVESLNSNYNFYLRAHGDMCNEIVLYCLPKENK